MKLLFQMRQFGPVIPLSQKSRTTPSKKHGTLIQVLQIISVTIRVLSCKYDDSQNLFKSELETIALFRPLALELYY